VPTSKVPAIEVRDLVKRYRGAAAPAVDSISFDVPDGRLFCLLGPNGAGKTTTISILTTVLAPTSGRVLVAGCDLATRRADIRARIGVVFQRPALDANLTAEENIRLQAVAYGRYPWRPLLRLMPAAYRRQVADLAGILGIEAALHRPVRSLSGGTRRKLEIVRALLHEPEVLFLDEPTTGLDPGSRRSLWSHLARTRATIVLTTHYLEEAEAADAICVLDGGRIIERGTPAEIKARQASPTLEEAYLSLLGNRR
jgi:ABC-2 type transport system ATP-binding protein